MIYKEYIYDETNPLMIKVKDIFHEYTNKGLYASIRLSRTNKHKYLNISFSEDCDIDIDNFLKRLEPITNSNQHFITETILSCVIAERELKEEEDLAQIINEIYFNNNKEVYYEPYLEGDDEFFINSSGGHNDFRFNSNEIIIKLEKKEHITLSKLL